MLSGLIVNRGGGSGGDYFKNGMRGSLSNGGMIGVYKMEVGLGWLKKVAKEKPNKTGKIAVSQTHARILSLPSGI